MTALWNGLLGTWTSLRPWARFAMVAWLVTWVCLPIVKRIWGDRAMRWGVAMAVVLQATAVVFVLEAAWGWGRTILTGTAVVVMGWVVEFVGSRTGFPFGRYHYTHRLQPQVGDVPLLIPLAWLMSLPPAWAVADAISGGRGLGFVVMAGLAVAAWDLFLDPQMVGWRLWVWERRGGYFGIPWSNYLGWALASGAMTAIARPDRLPAAPLGLIYAITWLMETVGLGVIWRQPGPALCGFLGMGGILLWAWLASR
jgi:putative membrane protein